MKNLMAFISSKKIIIIAAIVILAVGYIGFNHSDSSDSQASDASEKYFTCITVEPGDSLWSIAEEYMTEEYDSVQDYINEVEEINNLKNTNIVSGTSLLVPYYEVRNY
jgi:cell division protein YceG involved in septum cleavage